MPLLRMATEVSLARGDNDGALEDGSSQLVDGGRVESDCTRLIGLLEGGWKVSSDDMRSRA